MDAIRVERVGEWLFHLILLLRFSKKCPRDWFAELLLMGVCTNRAGGCTKFRFPQQVVLQLYIRLIKVLLLLPLWIVCYDCRSQISTARKGRRLHDIAHFILDEDLPAITSLTAKTLPK